MRAYFALVFVHAVSSTVLGISLFSASHKHHVPAPLFPLLVLIAECLKLLVFCILGNTCTLTSVTATHAHRSTQEHSSDQLFRPPATPSELQQPGSSGKDKAAATSSWTAAALAACIPAVCCTAANYLSLNALTLTSHAYTYSLLWCLSIVSTGLCSRWCLQPRPATAACRTAAKGSNPQLLRCTSPVDTAAAGHSGLPSPTYKTLAVLLLAELVGLWASGKAAAPAAEQQQQQHYSNVKAALMMLGVAVLTTGAQLSMLATSRSASRSTSVIKHHMGVVGLSNVWLHAKVAGGSIACSIIWLLWQQQQNSWHSSSSSSSSYKANDLLQSMLPGNSSSSNQGIQVAFWQSAIALAALGVAAAVLQQHQQQQSSSTNICGGSSHASSAAAASAASCAGAMPSLHIMYAIVLAVPFTSISSSVLLQDQPPLLFQAAAAVAVAMVVFYHYTCSPTLQKIVCRLDKAVGDCGGWRGTLFRIWKAAFVVKVAVLLLLPLYMATGSSSSSTTTTSSSSSSGIRLTHVSNWLTNNSSKSSSSLDRLPGLVVIKESFPNSSFLQDSNSSTSDSGSSAVYQFLAGIAPQMLTAVTNTRFPADLLSLPEQQQQQQRWQRRMQALCPAVDCVSNASCTIHAPECCAYYNVRFLAFLDYFLQRQGLAGQYSAVYGSLLSAINDSWFSRTAAPDVGISGAALQQLQQLEVRLALWRHGYVLLSSITAADGADSSDATSFSSSISGFSSRDSNSSSSSSQGLRVWRLCAHRGHPSHHWRRRFRPAQQQLKQDNAALTAARQAFIQLHLMWPANTTSTTSSSSGGSSSTGGINWLSTLASTPAASSGAGTPAAAAGPSSSSAAAAAAGGGAGASQWQLCLSDVVLLSSGAYGVNLSGLVFPAPDNTRLLLSSAYGAWQQLLQQQGQGQDPARGQQDRAAEVEQHKAIAAAAAAAGQKLGGGTVTAPLVRKAYARDVCLQKTLELLSAGLDGTFGSSGGSDSGSSSSSVLADRGAGSSSTADGVGSGNERDSSTQPVSSSAVIIGSVDEGSAVRSDNSSSSDVNSSDVNSSDTSSGRNPGSTTGISVAGALVG